MTPIDNARLIPGPGALTRACHAFLLFVQLFVLLLALPALLPAQSLAPPGPSLKLLEKGGFIELPADVFNDFSEATVEAWVKWNAFGNRYQRIFNYGAGDRDFGLTTLTGTNTLWFVISGAPDGMKIAKLENTLKAGEWTHVAAVAGSEGMRLFLNGELVATNPYTGCFNSLGNGNANRIGQTVTAGVDDTPFDGELAEVRVWKTARSAEQIRANLLKQLSGTEEGLAALWNFNDPANPGRDAGPNGFDGKLVAGAGGHAPPPPVEPAPPTHDNAVLTLNGVDAWMDLPTGMLDGLKDVTVEAWVKWDGFDPNTWTRVFHAALASGDISLGSGANVWFVVHQVDETVGYKWANTGFAPRPGEWVHLAGVAGRNGMKLYLNGTLVARNAYAGAPADWDRGYECRIGRSIFTAPSETPFAGQVDELRVWSVSRTQDEIRANITGSLTGSEPGLVGLWNFDDPAHPGRDASPHHHDGKLVGGARAAAAGGAPAPAVKARPDGKDALALDGVNPGIETDGEWFADVSDNFTMECWALPTTARGEPDRDARVGGVRGQRYLFFPAQGTSALGGDPHAGVGVSLGTNGVAVVEHADHHMPLVVDVATPITDWVHVAVVYRDKTPSLYLNGTLAGSGPRSSRTPHPSLWNWKQNGQAVSSAYRRFGGALDEVRIWNVPLNEEEIRARMGLPLTGNEPGLVGWWNFDDPANPGRDASPRHRDASVTAPLLSSLVGVQTPTAFQFKGNVLELNGDGGMETGAVIIPTASEYTVECWAFTPGIDTKNLRIIAAQDRQFYLGTTLAGKVRLGDSWDNTGAPFPAGSWHHFAFCKGSDGASLYIDGNLAASRARALSPPSETGTFRIGRQWGTDPGMGGEQWKGFVDDVRVWKTARTEEQVRENLTKTLRGDEPDLIGLWNFDDGTAKDLSAGAHHGNILGNARIVPAASAGVTLGTGLGSAASLSGRITDAAGTPVRGAEVRVMQGESPVGTVKSGDGGDYFLLFARRPAPYRVLVSWENLEGASPATEFVEGPNKLDLTLQDTLRLSGTLVGPDDQPRRGVKVEALGADAAVPAFSVTDARGQFALRRLPDGEYTLRAAGVTLNEGMAFAARADAPQTGLKLTLPAVPAPERPPSENRVLALDGSGAHLSLPAGMFGNLRETTVEAWVRFGTLKGFQRFFSYGRYLNDMYLGKDQSSPDLQLGTQISNEGWRHADVRGVLEEKRWCHVAAVIGGAETRLYFNGTLAAVTPKVHSFDLLAPDSPAYIGRWSDEGSGFSGEIDEVRVWAEARTDEEIRAAMFQRLSGREEGLAGMWSFDDAANPGRDLTPNGFDGTLKGSGTTNAEPVPTSGDAVTKWAALSGVTIGDDSRALGDVKILLERGAEKKEVQSDGLGNFSLIVPASSDPWQLSAVKGDLEAKPQQLVLGEEGTLKVSLALRDAAMLSGRILAPDDSPLPTVVVRAIPVAATEGAPVFTPGLRAEIYQRSSLTRLPEIPASEPPDLVRVDSNIDFPLAVNSIAGPEFNGRLYVRWSGTIRIETAGEYTFFLAANEGGRLLIDGKEVAASSVPSGGTTTLDSIEKSGVVTLTPGRHDLSVEMFNPKGRDGCRLLWSAGGGEKTSIPETAFSHRPQPPGIQTTMTNSRGKFRFPRLVPGQYTLLAQLPGGSAAWDGGKAFAVGRENALTGLDFRVPPFKKGWWTSYSHTDGLADDQVQCVLEASDGAMWFGSDGGVSRFDGVTFKTLTTRDGLPNAWVESITEAGDGSFLFRTRNGLWRHQPGKPGSALHAFSFGPGNDRTMLVPVDDSKLARNSLGVALKSDTGNGTTPLPSFSAMTKDPSGRIWLAAGKDLWRSEPTSDAAGGLAFRRLTRRQGVLVTSGRAPSGNPGILRGSAALASVDDKPLKSPGPDRALVLDGNGSYLELPPLALNGNTMTVTAWLKRNVLQKDSPHILSARAAPEGAGNDTFGLFVDGSGTDLRYNWLDSTEAHNWKSGLAPPVGSWFFVALVVTPTDATLYLDAGDGMKSATHVMTHDVMRMAGPLLIGNDMFRGLGPRHWNGAIDDVRIWDRALSPEEVQAAQATAAPAAEAGRRVLWDFDGETRLEEREVPFSAENDVESCFIDAGGTAWIGMAGGVARFDGKDLTTFTTKDGLAAGTVTAIHQSPDGALWFGTDGHGISRYLPPAAAAAGETGSPASAPAAEKAWTTFTQNDGLIHNQVRCIASDARGIVWIAASEENSSGGEVPTGLSRYDGKSFVNFTVADGLASEVVSALHLDAHGGVWVGTLSGVSHYDDQSLITYDFQDGLDDGAIRNLASTGDGSVWIQVGENPGKLARFDGQRMLRVTRDDGLPGTDVTSLFTDDSGALLVGDLNAPIARFDPAALQGGSPRFEPLPESGGVRALGRSSTGDLWLGDNKGASILGEPGSLKEIGIARFVRAGQNGDMWFVARPSDADRESIWRHDGSTFSEFTRGLPERGLTFIRGLEWHQGFLVAATMNGALRLQGDAFAPWPPDYPRLQQLRCFDVHRDSAGRLWLGTAEGAHFTDGVAWGKIDVRDHLRENSVNRVHVTADGTVWLGTWFKGISRYRPQRRPLPPPALTVKTDREFLDPASLTSVEKGQRITFKCDVVDLYTKVEKRQFRWQVFRGARSAEDLKTGWQKPEKLTEMEPSLDQPGDWTVAVQYIDRDLNYSPPAFANLKVVLPWQANPAIMLPAGTGVAGLLGWAFVARLMYMRKRREAERLREKLLEEEHAARQAAERARAEIETKNRQLEEARAAAEDANRTKSQFLANMSHELRTPMNAIIGYSEMLQEEAEDLGQKDIIPDLQKIHGAGKHLLGLINDILDLSKVEAGKMTLFLEDFDVARLVQEVAATVQPLVAKNGNTLTVECPADTGVMRADVTKLRQTLFNLLSNACKFTEKGAITLRVTSQITDLKFEIRDTGIGMTPEQMRKLFQAFTQADASTTRKFGGTGLGLAISRKFCQLMGGDITVRSEAGKGATFTATLPREVMEPAPEAAPAVTAAEPAPATGRRPSPATVLVIDDDANVRDLMERTLAREGYQVVTAGDGHHGLALARELKPSVITLDVMMPGMDGWAVLSALKADPATADLPVLMMTIVDDKTMGFALGAADYFTKPIDWHRLSVALKKHRPSAAARTVLVVEDDATMREMFRRTLEKDGWKVSEAENGRLGLERLAVGNPAIILLDLMMPEMDGFTFMEELRTRPDGREIPVIVITAKDLTDDDRRRLNGQVERIIQKGAHTPADLLREIRSLIAAAPHQL